MRLRRRSDGVIAVPTTAGAWTTADYALIVSLCSAGISLISLGWNIWSKFIFPRGALKISTILAPGRANTYIIEAVNVGPVDISVREPVGVTTRGWFLRGKHWWSLKKVANFLGGGVPVVEGEVWPRRLRPGEYFSISLETKILSMTKNKPIVGVGFMDSFERIYLMSGKAFKDVKKTHCTARK